MEYAILRFVGDAPRRKQMLLAGAAIVLVLFRRFVPTYYEGYQTIASWCIRK